MVPSSGKNCARIAGLSEELNRVDTVDCQQDFQYFDAMKTVLKNYKLEVLPDEDPLFSLYNAFSEDAK